MAAGHRGRRSASRRSAAPGMTSWPAASGPPCNWYFLTERN